LDILLFALAAACTSGTTSSDTTGAAGGRLRRKAAAGLPLRAAPQFRRLRVGPSPGGAARAHAAPQAVPVLALLVPVAETAVAAGIRPGGRGRRRRLRDGAARAPAVAVGGAGGRGRRGRPLAPHLLERLPARRQSQSAPAAGQRRGGGDRRHREHRGAGGAAGAALDHQAQVQVACVRQGCFATRRKGRTHSLAVF